MMLEGHRIVSEEYCKLRVT